MIQNEVSILRRVKHPNIVLLIEEVDTYNELYLVMELVKVCSHVCILQLCVVMWTECVICSHYGRLGHLAKLR